jgi:hypothetical protein
MKAWIEAWNRDSILRVCTLCDTNFDVTKGGDGMECRRLGEFEVPARRQVPRADAFRVYFEELCLSSRLMCNEPSPWWMNVLRSRAL